MGEHFLNILIIFFKNNTLNSAIDNNQHLLCLRPAKEIPRLNLRTEVYHIYFVDLRRIKNNDESQVHRNINACNCDNII